MKKLHQTQSGSGFPQLLFFRQIIVIQIPADGLIICDLFLIDPCRAAVQRVHGHLGQLVLLCKITEANTAVCGEMQRSGKRTGTTASMLLFDQAGGYSVCNLGDSPVLLIRDGSITEISVEHTERQKFEEVTGKKAAPGKKFKLTQHIGIFPEEMEIEPHLYREQVRPSDVFLICSDGLTDMVPYEAILDTVTRSETAEDAVAALCTMAKDAGGKRRTGRTRL